MLSGPTPTIARARHLRRDMSLPEVLLWKLLRTRPAGHKFRRQHPAGPYVLDFYCHEAALAIEIDGEAHDRGDQPKRDERRDGYLGGLDIRVLRITAREVLSDIEAVLDHILAAADAAAPLHQPSAGPPPLKGEDFVRSL